MRSCLRSLAAAVVICLFCLGCGSSEPPPAKDDASSDADATAVKQPAVETESPAEGPASPESAVADRTSPPVAQSSEAPTTTGGEGPESEEPAAEPIRESPEQPDQQVATTNPTEAEAIPPTETAEDLETAAKPQSEEKQPSTAEALQSEELLGRYHQLLRRRPLHGPAFNGLVKHYSELGNLKELVGEYERKVEALPDDESLRIVLARLYLRSGQAEQAARIVDEDPPDLTKPDTEDPKLLAFKSAVYQRVGRTDEAEAMLERALTQAKTISERIKLTESLADLLVHDDKRERAGEVLIRLAEEYPDQYFHRKRIADALAARELHQQAVAQFREILPLVETETDKRCEVLRQLGKSLEKLGRRGDAIDVYAQAINLLSGDHWLQRELQDRLVALYRASGRLEDLIEYCQGQIRRSPEQTALRELLADVFNMAGKADEAKQTLADAVELFPRDRNLSEKRIRLMDRGKDEEGASSEYERIISQHPEDVELYVAYGQFLARHEQLDKARQQWKHVLGQVADATLANRLGSLFEQYDLTDDAVECYRRAITLNPERPESYTALARLWIFQGQRDQAVSTLKRMTEANPDRAEMHAELAQSLLGMGMLDEALKAVIQACKLAPEQYRYQLARADLLLRTSRIDEALKVRRALIDLIPNPQQQRRAIDTLVSMHESAKKLDLLQEAESARLAQEEHAPVSRLILARLSDFQRDFVSAKEHLGALLEGDPGHEEGRRQLAKLQEAMGDLDAAVKQYRTLIELHPARARYYFQAIADLRLRYHDKAGAIATFQEMVQAAPQNAAVLQAVGEQLVRLDALEEAIGYYERSLAQQPANHATRLEYANALHKAGRLEQALVEFKQTALQSVDRDSATAALGRLHETAGQLGMLDDLIEELEARVEQNPDATQVARMLAELFIREYEYTRSMELLDLLVEQHPRDPELRLVRGELLRRLTRFEDALEEYGRLLRFPNLDRDYVLGALGKTYFEAGRLEEARQTWQRINNKLYCGTLLKNNGLLTEAIAVFQEGIRLRPDDYTLHRNLIQTFQKAGKVEESLEAARRLLDLEPDNVLNIRQLARAYAKRGDRAVAASIASRLFSAGVGRKKPLSSSGSQFSYSGMPVWAMSMMASYGGYGNSGGRNNLERAVAFFRENGLMAELESILAEQLEAQPENALLKRTAAQLLSEEFAQPDAALKLLQELETAEFPLEYRQWLGQASQADYFRLQQYRLIASKPALQGSRVVALEGKDPSARSRDENIELATIRQVQGATDKAIALLDQAVEADGKDVVALSLLVDTLTRAERFLEAEPHTLTLIERLTTEREQMRVDMRERVRRDFVRSLPVQLQLRVTEELLDDIAAKWTLGQAFGSEMTGFAQLMGYFRAKLTLATIYAKTDRIAEAREIWQDLEPSNPADSDGWTMLAAVTQLQEQQDLAFRYYERALASVKLLAADPLLNRIYGGSTSNMWYGGEEVIDSSFNKIVEAFAGQNKLVELYDFLRDSDQMLKARRVRDQYKLANQLEALYHERFQQAKEDYLRGEGDALDRSVPYFLHACKLAEIHDQRGNWPEALRVYQQYLEDFPDELGLLTTLSEVAEAQADYEQALRWEKKIVDAKTRLVRKARQWSQRTPFLTPSIPQALAGGQNDQWQWSSRWGKGYAWWGYGSQGNTLDLWTTWMRIAQLYLATDNTIAAADAMQRAIRAPGTNRSAAADQVLKIVQARGLTEKMLPVLRSLAILLPSEQRVQLAFAQSLEANAKQVVATEVYERMLRRGVSDIGVLARVRRKLEALRPESGEATGQTLVALESVVAADPQNARNLLRLAKAYFYSLQVDQALETLLRVQEIAPHLDELHRLFVEVYTVKGDSGPLVDSLRAMAARSTEDAVRRSAQRRLVDELLAVGKRDEALEELKKIPDPQEPDTYVQVGKLLAYFGRYDDAIEQFELAAGSQSQNPWYGARYDGAIVGALALKGDLPGVADRLLDVLDKQLRQASQYGGLAGMAALYDNQENPFDAFVPLFILYPSLIDEVEQRLTARRQEKPKDLHATKTLMQFYRRTGQDALAEAIFQEAAEQNVNDAKVVTRLIDRAVERKQYARAIEIAEQWVSQQPKPKLPPGMPAQYAGMMSLMSGRNLMLCRIGDLYWKLDDKQKAFESYHQIVDEQVDESKIAYATLCALRGRTDEARAVVEETLAKQKVQSPSLLQFRAFLSLLEGNAEKAFDALAESLEIGGGQAVNPFSYGDDANQGVGLLVTLAKQADLVDRLIVFLEKRIEKNRNEWKNHFLLAKTLREVGRSQEAFGVLDGAAKVPTLKKEALQQRIQWIEGFAPAEELIPLYIELIQLSEKKVSSVLSGFGRFFGGGGGSQEQDDTQPLRDRLGDLLWQTGDAERAEKVWTARMNKDQASTQISMGQRYLEKEAYELAKPYFSRALEIEPHNTQARQALAALAFARGDRAETLEHMRDLFTERFAMSVAKNSNSQGQSWSPYRGSYGNAGSEWGSEGGEAEEIRRWAIDLVRRVDSAAPSSQSDVETRLMLATLTGDWQAAQSELDFSAQTSPFDSMIWYLLARNHERNGKWDDAAGAWRRVLRLRETTLPDRRDQLKLVLAGDQVKQAAGGMTSATATGMPTAAQQGAMASIQFSGASSYGGMQDGLSSRLASLLIKVQKYDEAELAYLRGQSDLDDNVLPALINLLQQQDGQERALALLKLSLTGTQRTYQTSQLTLQLAQLEQPDEAIQLLVRTYRLHQARESSRNSMMMYGGWYAGAYGMSDSGWEADQQSSAATSLHQLLMRHGKLDETLAKLGAELAANPKDVNLAKLILSLQLKAGRTQDAKETIATLAETWQPDDKSAAAWFQVYVQMEDWPGAIALCEQARQSGPEKAAPWRLREAVVLLLSGDTLKAREAIGPLLDESADGLVGVEPNQVISVLAAMDLRDELIRYLESKKTSGALDESQHRILYQLYQVDRQWDKAMRLALDRFWKSSNPLAETDWFGTLGRLAHTPEAEVAAVVGKSDRPEDSALLQLLIEGSASGKDAFRTLVGQQPDNLNARRGLVLAATLDRDYALALRANGALIDWLVPRRQDVWQLPEQESPATRTTEFVKRLQQQTVDGQSILGMSFSFSQMLQQMMTGNTYGSEPPQPVTHEVLWYSHQKIHRDLVLENAKADEYLALIKSQAEHAAARSTSSQSDTYGYSYSMYGTAFSGWSGSRSGFGQQEGFEQDWREPAKQALYRFGLFEPLAEYFEQRGSRVASDDWLVVSEVYAALGRTGASDKWKEKWIEHRMASILATDGPDVTGGSDAYAWRWRWYGEYDQPVQNARSALQVTVGKSDDEERDPWASQRSRGPATQLWQLALVDPKAESRLLELAEIVGPDWNKSQALRELKSYYEEKEQPIKVIELLERVFTTEKLVRSDSLSQYLKACYLARDFSRVEKALDAVMKVSKKLENDVRLHRLVLLRYQGKDAEANRFEEKLVAECVPAEDRVPPWQDSSELLRAMQSLPAVAGQSWVQGNRWSGRWSAWSSLASKNSVTRALNMNLPSKDSPEDLTLTRIRSTYRRHGFYQHAARILDRELTERQEQRTEEERMRWLSKKAAWLDRAGQGESARQLLAEVEAFHQKRAQADPADPAPHKALAELYASKSFGEDNQKAYDAFLDAARREADFARSPRDEASYLFKLGRHAEAWEKFSIVHARGNLLSNAKTETLIKAGIAAHEAGARNSAGSLLRMGLWRDPKHELAPQAREALHE